MQLEDNENGVDLEWDHALDAVVAAPEHHTVIFENEYVRVLDARIVPGETVPIHTHRWPSVVYTLNSGDFIRYDVESETVLDSRMKPVGVEIDRPVALPPLRPHSVDNVGNTELRAIAVEIKTAEKY